jgi:hypothetical protein
MPHLTFSTSPDGPALPVRIGVDGKNMADLHATGQTIPPPLALRGLIDSGTDITCVAPWVLRQLGLVSAGSSSTQTAGGSVKVNLFDVSVTISGPAGKAGPMLVRDQLIVMELTQALPNIDALIGRDILNDCLFILDGPGKQFTLAF